MTTESPVEVRTPQTRCRFAIRRAEITPPVGIYNRMWGAAAHDRAEGVHRPICVTVAALRPLSGDSHARLLVALDFCVVLPDEHADLVAAVSERTSVPAAEVLVVCSHTHGVGIMNRDRAALPGGELIAEYMRNAIRVAADVASDAIRSCVDATIVYGTGRCNLARNRDFWDAAGKQYVCGFNPSDGADDTVIVARVTADDGQTLASIVNYACHPTTLAWQNRLISPDYPAAMRETVENSTGAPCLFLQGAAGELGPQRGFVGDPQTADRNGRQLGHAALSALEGLPPAQTVFRYTGSVHSGATIGTWDDVAWGPGEAAAAERWGGKWARVPLDYRRELPKAEEVRGQLEQLEEAARDAADAGDSATAAQQRAEAERKRRLLARVQTLPAGDCYPLRVDVWQLGDAVWVGVQGEPYSELQSSLRERFPDCAILVAGVAHDWGAGYVPPVERYGKGIYQESIAVVAAGSLDQLIDEIAKHIGQLRGATSDEPTSP